MALFCSTLVRPTAVANAKNSPQIDKDQQAAPETTAATFPGTGVGAIPDSPGGTPPVYGTPLVISYAASGLTAPVTDVSVDITLTHSWVGDLDMVLAAPGGGTSVVVVGHIGATTAGSFGDSSNYGGTYTFSDTAVGTNIWTVATAVACGDTCAVTPGSYRGTARGTTGQTNPPPLTNITATFAGLTTAQVNGTWTLTIRDGGGGDTGSVTASNLSITGGSGNCTTVKRPLDYDGDGKTDPTTVRNTGGGPSGQITWFTHFSGGADRPAQPWGSATDFFVSGDYDGDGKQDIAVWRAAAPGATHWFILRSSNNTLLDVLFGQSGDDPTVTGDYDGDGKADPAVYRAGQNAGDKSTWYWLGSVDGLQHGYVFGQNGDFPAPGDYDGDNKYDFVVQRNGGGGGAIFFEHLTTAGDTALWFGTPTDSILPGYYDSDCKADIAVSRNSGGQYFWYIRNSTDGSTTTYIFGTAGTDFYTQGDWDGDGKTDIGVWRPAVDPTQNFFYWRRSIDGALGSFEWGQNGDYPVANFNQH